MECLFCRIIRKEIPAQIVFENKDILAFRDINPQAPVHLLIVPRKHIGSLNDIGPGDSVLLGEIQEVARDLAYREHISAGGYRVVLNCGAAAGQAVAHLHYHLLGGRAFSWPPG